MEVRKRRLPWVLMALGAVMALCALGMLLQTRGVLQYCVTAPAPTEKGENLLALNASALKAGDDLGEALGWTALGGECGTVSVSGTGASEEVNLIAIGEGWLEVYPRFLIKGRRMGEGEIAGGAAVILLDDGLAFRLFGTELPEGATVKVNGASYAVVGTVRHGGSVFGGRGVGDTVPYDAYIPLVTAINRNVPIAQLVLSALPRDASGAQTLFEQAAQAWTPGGQLVNLDKEAMRRTILPRVLLLILGLYALTGLFRRMTDLAAGWFADFREALKGSYLKALLPRLIWLILRTLLGYAILVGLTYLLLVFSAQPLYVFTEWVPDNLVEWSSLTRVFWNLTSQSARLLRLGTRELRVIEFWGGLMRWGVVLVLFGAALLPKARFGKGRKRA